MRRILGFLIVAIIVSAGGSLCRAEDEALYDALPSPDSTYIRLINLNTDQSVRPLRLDRKILDGAAYGDATPYYAVRRGDIKITVGDRSVTKILAQKKFYTIVETPEALKFVEDKPIQNTSKAIIGLYVYSKQGGLYLKTSDGKTGIIAATQTGEENYKEINPVKVSMAVYGGMEKLEDLGERNLVRGHSYTVLVYDNLAKKPKVNFIETQIKTVK